MKSQEASHVITCPDIADGNPWALYALENLAEEAGVEAYTKLLKRWNGLVRMTHGAMTSHPRLAEFYTRHSESYRAGFVAGLYSNASLNEVTDWLDDTKPEKPIHWLATQEHAMRSAYSGTYADFGVTSRGLVIQDSKPKESAIQAAEWDPEVTFYVWNHDASQELEERGVRTKLVRPFLVAGMSGTGELPAEGTEVVVKTSGNGMPGRWAKGLLGALGEVDGLSWSMHTPETIHTNARPEGEKLSDRHARIARLCGEFAVNTRVLIGFPTELTQVVSELQLGGASTRFISLPPRGAHELVSMQFMQRHGLLAGELQFRGKQRPSLTDGRLITLSELPGVIEALCGTETHPTAIKQFGQDHIWDVITAEAEPTAA